MGNNNGYDKQAAACGINHFFDVYRLPAAIALMESLLEAATLPNVWRREQPANAVCFMENMGKLFSAAGAFPKRYQVNNKAITGASIVQGRTAHTLANNQHSNHAWETFPRSLTAKQCANPFSAISQCCAFMPEAEWRNLLNDITECALSNTTLYEMQPECNILRVRRYLLRLLEGCHLIGLRSEEKTATNTKCVM